MPFITRGHNYGRNDDFQFYSSYDWPKIKYDIYQPSPYVRIDAVPVDTPFIPTYYGFNSSREFNTSASSLDISTLDNFAGVRSYGIVEAMVGQNIEALLTSTYTTRDFGGYGSFSAMFTRGVALDNGTRYEMPKGDYRVLIRALKVGFSYTDAAGYESWLSPIISW
jgi:hypothetical protein